MALDEGGVFGVSADLCAALRGHLGCVADVVQILVGQDEPAEVGELDAVLREQLAQGVHLAGEARVHQQGALGILQEHRVYGHPGGPERPLELEDADHFR